MFLVMPSSPQFPFAVRAGKITFSAVFLTITLFVIAAFGFFASASLAASPTTSTSKTKTAPAPVPSQAQLIFSIKPSPETPTGYYKLNIHPGQTITETFKVENLGKQRGTAHIYAVDGATGADSGAVYRITQTHGAKYGSWIHLSASYVTLNPRQSNLITATIHVPKNAGNGYRLAGIVTQGTTPQTKTLPNSTKRVTLNVVIVTSVVDAVEMNLGAPYHDQVTVSGATIGSVALRQAIFYAMKDTGNTLCKGSGQSEVFNSSNTLLKKHNFIMDYLVPYSNTIAFPVVFSHEHPLPAGKYRTTIHGTCGNYAFSGSFPFSISTKQSQSVLGAVPPGKSILSHFPAWVWGLIGLAILLLLLIILFFRRRHKKAAEELEALRAKLAEAEATGDTQAIAEAAGAVAVVIAAGKRDEEEEEAIIDEEAHEAVLEADAKASVGPLHEALEKAIASGDAGAIAAAAAAVAAAEKEAKAELQTNLDEAITGGDAESIAAAAAALAEVEASDEDTPSNHS